MFTFSERVLTDCLLEFCSNPPGNTPKLPKCHAAPLFTVCHPGAHLSPSPLFHQCSALCLSFLKLLLSFNSFLITSLSPTFVFPLHAFRCLGLSLQALLPVNLPDMWDPCPPRLSSPRARTPAYRISVSVLREENRARTFPWVDQTKSLARFTSV